jgi:cytochrome P450
MPFRDPPDHTRLRALVNRAFTPRVVESMRGQIQGVVDGLLDRVERQGRMDVIADLAYPLPVTVVCDTLRVPVGDHERIKEWSSDIIRSLDAIGVPSDPSIVVRGHIGRRGIADYFRALLPERRRRPRADLLSALIAVEEQGDRLTEGELLATCVLLFIAGHETTVNLIGNGLLALLRHPAEVERLRRHPALIGGAVEELLRYDSPVQRTARITNADVELGGSASIPAFATCPSCGAVPPETPMAPMILPSAMIGMPPSIGLAPVRRRRRRLAPPWATASSNALVGRRNATADQALSRATSMLPSGAPSMRCSMTTLPPASRIVMTMPQLFFLDSASAPAIAFFACSSVMGGP